MFYSLIINCVLVELLGKLLGALAILCAWCIYIHHTSWAMNHLSSNLNCSGSI